MELASSISKSLFSPNKISFRKKNLILDEKNSPRIFFDLVFQNITSIHRKNLILNQNLVTVTNKIDYTDPIMKKQIRITEQMGKKFITAVKDKSIVGYKYFNFENAKWVAMEIRGTFKGKITVSHDEAGSQVIGTKNVDIDSDVWTLYDIKIKPNPGKQALYFHFDGTGELDFKEFIFSE